MVRFIKFPYSIPFDREKSPSVVFHVYLSVRFGKGIWVILVMNRLAVIQRLPGLSPVVYSLHEDLKQGVPVLV